MDIWESAKVLARRWYVVLPILAVFALAAIFVGGQIDPEYRSSASMVILPQRIDDGSLFQNRSADAPQNPLDYLGGQTTLTSIELILGTEATRSELAAAGFSPQYTMAVDSKDPLMLIEVLDRDPVVVQATVDELVIRVRETLDTLQATVNAPTSDLLEIQVLSQNQTPTEDFAGRMRIRMILAVLGVLLASGAALLTEAWYSGRTRKHAAEDAEAPTVDRLEAVEAPDDLDPMGGNGSANRDDSARESDVDDEYVDSYGETERELVAAPGPRATIAARGPQK